MNALRHDPKLAIYISGAGVGCVLAFTSLTRRFFLNLAQSQTQGFEVRPTPVLPLAEKSPVE